MLKGQGKGGLPKREDDSPLSWPPSGGSVP